MEEWRRKFINQYGYDPLMAYPGPGPGYVMPADYTRDRDVQEDEPLAPVEPYAPTAPVAAAAPATTSGFSLMGTAQAAEPSIVSAALPQVDTVPGTGLDQTGIQVFPPGVTPPRGDDTYAVRPGESIGEARERLAPLIEGAGYGQPVGPNQITPETHPDLYGITPTEEQDRIWAKYPLDLDAKRQRRLEALGKVNKNAMMLRVFAALTGSSTAHAQDYITNSMSRFNENEEYRADTRIQNLQRVLHFDAEGNLDSPSSNKEAYERVIEAKGTHAEAALLSGYLPKVATTDARTSAIKNAQAITALRGEANRLRVKAEKAAKSGNIELSNAYEAQAQIADKEADTLERQLGGMHTLGQRYDDIEKYFTGMISRNFGKDAVGTPIIPINAATGQPVTIEDFINQPYLELYNKEFPDEPPIRVPGWPTIEKSVAGGSAVDAATADEGVSIKIISE
jgi:hypothetical protein